MPSPPLFSWLDESAAAEAAGSLSESLGLQLSDRPEIGVILGSGLGAAADRLSACGGWSIVYSEIPGMPVPHISGHSGRLVLGQIDGKSVAMLQGRVHYYEGHSLDAIVFGTRLLSHLGITTLIVTNAAGGIAGHFAPGDLMLISSHIRPLAATELNIGQVLNNLTYRSEEAEQRHSCLWSPQLRATAKTVPTELRVHEGVYAMMTGPTYETPAEIRMMKSLGADAVGMSTVPEAMFAASRGIQVLGVSCITNVAAGLSDKTLDHQDVTATACSIEVQFVNWLWNVIKCIE